MPLDRDVIADVFRLILNYHVRVEAPNRYRIGPERTMEELRHPERCATTEDANLALLWRDGADTLNFEALDHFIDACLPTASEADKKAVLDLTETKALRGDRTVAFLPFAPLADLINDRNIAFEHIDLDADVRLT